MLLLYTLVFSCSNDSRVTRPLKLQKNLDFDATHFVIVAHPDDWQLFMGDFTYDLLENNKTRVILVILDAGDAGRGADYWSARENASMASVRSVYNLDLLRPGSDETTASVRMGHTNISRVNLKNTSSYFYRMPDGSPEGYGFDTYGNESLYKLWKGKIDSIQSVDGKSRYSLSELQDSLRDLVFQESVSSSKVVFHILDSGPQENFAHSDHFVSQELARELAQDLKKEDCKIYAFEDYRSKTKTINIETVAEKKVQLFNAYDLYMLSAKQECTVCNRIHFEWLFRTYYRVFSC